METEPQAKKILFLTGTRADFGKLKPLIEEVERSEAFEAHIFATGMHTLARYGSTVNEIRKAGFQRIYSYINQDGSVNSQMDLVLANTIQGMGHYLRECHPDLIVVHGDRIEALAGATVGALNNVLVAHIEGGEISGTVDELIRHAVSKLSHLHFVSNDEARRRLVQMGETKESIFVIGSPDIDVMLSDQLPELAEVKDKYEIRFSHYVIFAYHPVTTELSSLRARIDMVVSALEASEQNFVVLYPNNDSGSDIILEAFGRLQNNPHFRVIPSMRFEHFLTLLKNAMAIVGNSSAGIREAPVYGIPVVNIGSRQSNRFNYPAIVNVPEDKEKLIDAMRHLPNSIPSSTHFGSGNSAELFIAHLKNARLWMTPRQKQFRDLHLKERSVAESLRTSEASFSVRRA